MIVFDFLFQPSDTFCLTPLLQKLGKCELLTHGVITQILTERRLGVEAEKTKI